MMTQISDKAQSHAIYLSRRQELKLLVILHILEHIRRMDPSAFLATSKEAGERERY